MKGLLFTYVMTYGGAIAALLHPFYGLLVYVSFSILRPETLWFWSVPPGNYSRIVAVAMLLGWAIRGCGSWNFSKSRPIVFCFVGLWCWGALATFVAADNKTAAYAWLEMIAKILLPFLVGVTTIHTVKQLRALAWTIFLSQSYVALELNLAYYSGWNRMLEGYGSLDNNVMSIAMVAAVGLGFFLGIGSKRLWQRALCLVGVALMMHSILFAFSRGGMLALCVAGIVTFVIVPKRPHAVVLAIAMVLLGFQLMGAEVTDRFLQAFTAPTERDKSAQSRLELWGQAWTVIQEEPIFGVGPDNWGDVARNRFGWPGRKEAHSLWMQTGAELGIPGLTLVVGFYAFCICRLWKFTREHSCVQDPDIRTFARVVVSALAAFIVAASFVTVERLEMPYYLVLLGAATLRIQSTVIVQHQRPQLGFASFGRLLRPPTTES